VKTLLLFIILVSILLSVFSVLKTNHAVQALPSLYWTTLISIPLYSTWDYFDLSVLKYQFVGVTVIHSFILTSDLVTICLLEKSEDIKFSSLENFKFRIRAILYIIIIAFPIIQYARSWGFPIISRLDREHFNKLDSPYTLILLSMLAMSVLVPFMFIDSINKKSYFLAILLLIWIGLYIVGTGAKGNFVNFIGGVLISYALLDWKKRHKLIFSLFFIASITVVIFGILSIRSTENFSSSCKVPPTALSTPANLLRLNCPSTLKSNSTNLLPISLGYRVFLTPIEVSYYWYDLTLSNSNENRPILNLFDRGNENKFSNKIGLKYFVEPFPDSYGTSINANASIDADAFSFYRIYSVIFVGLIYFFIRLFLGVMSVHSRPSIRILSGLGLSKLILLPFSAGLQAILIPHGLALIVALILVLKSNYINSKIFK
jgi:hypothetical protein